MAGEPSRVFGDPRIDLVDVGGQLRCEASEGVPRAAIRPPFS